MSIYCTGYQFMIPIYVPCPSEDGKVTEIETVTERWIEVYFQHVPNHINVESGYDWDWLPEFQHRPDCVRTASPYWLLPDPEVPFIGKFVDASTPGAERHVEVSCECGDRCVFVIDEDHQEKDGQRYAAPLLVLSGAEYTAANFGDLMGRIERAMESRFHTPTVSPEESCEAHEHGQAEVAP